MCYTEGSDLYSIPFDISFAYTPPQVDPVPRSMQVQPGSEVIGSRVETIEIAIELYLQAFHEQFGSRPKAVRIAAAAIFWRLEKLRTDLLELRARTCQYR